MQWLEYFFYKSHYSFCFFIFLSMRKFLCILFIIPLAFFYACKTNTPNFDENIFILRTNLYYGENENFKLSAHYGFNKEKSSDYALTFTLKDRADDNIEYNVSLTFDQKEYKSAFKLNPVSGNLVADLYIPNFNQTQFTATITYSSCTEQILLNSTLPKEYKTYKQALQSLYESQNELFKSYSDSNGNFNAQMIVKAIVKNEKLYYYIAFKQDNSFKALLVDGNTLEVLAVRQIF